MSLNPWFDRVPRQTFDLGARRVPAFRSLGIIGFHVALVTGALVALCNGLPIVTAFAMSVVAAFSFFAWAMLRRTLAGRETLVLLEHVWVAFGAVGAYLWLTGGPIVAGLDVLAVALCPFLFFGRLGCFTVGCCHGHAASIGARYPAWVHHPPRLHGVRLFPVQLVEALGLSVIGIVGFALSAWRPGAASVWFLIAYASLRFGTEALRADRRPMVGPFSVPRLMCVVQAGVAMIAAQAWLTPGASERAAVIGGITVVIGAAAGATLVLARGRSPLLAPDHIDEVWATVNALAATASGHDPAVLTTSRELCVAVSDARPGLHVSLSHARRPVFAVGLALAPDHIEEVNGITHLRVLRRSMTYAPDEPGRPGQPARDDAAVALVAVDDADYFAHPARDELGAGAST